MKALRKLIAITLLVLFGMPFASALYALAPKNEADLPACCRRAGQHHCVKSMMGMMGISQGAPTPGDKPQLTALPEKCPYCPAVTTLGHQPNLMGPSSEPILFAGLVGQAAVVAQTESKRRISQDRSRQKRGPPASLLSHSV